MPSNTIKYFSCIYCGGFGNLTTTSFQKVANNVTGITLPNTGHFIPSERPNFVTKQILEFFR